MNNTLEKFILSKRSEGGYSFTLNEVRQALGSSHNAVKQTLYRHKKKGTIALLRKGFYLIISPEYSKRGMLPVYLFIDDLMKSLRKPYYLALFTAAALHGAAHQQPMESFVVTIKPTLRAIKNKKICINFFVKNKWDNRDIIIKKTDAGYVPVSSPELTALDLLSYMNYWGINRIVPIINELVDEMDSTRLSETARRHATGTAIQRLGFLLDVVFENHRLAKSLFEIIKNKKCYYVPLSPHHEKNGEFISSWKIIKNMEVESDL